ncbi:hypothetical protein EHO62_04220 [Leptospira kmetyi]|nr:hypothetical protein EHO62_04220 [Leptospira kmetyi]TGK28551.1 hypothetical protein EHO66_13700 [Leptospira kmetyi]TGL68080.1 hypothetical protein EHQ67_12875 [Leptospira kmetyi]
MIFLSFPDIRSIAASFRGNEHEFCDPIRLIGQFSPRFQEFKNFRTIQSCIKESDSFLNQTLPRF